MELRKRPQYSLVKVACLAPDSVWALWTRTKYFVPYGESKLNSSDVKSTDPSLNRLSYPSSQVLKMGDT
jgi:hypothetical protein